MGKQSGRLYYNGEDHFDLVFKGNGKDEFFANHSKIYLGNKLLWKREKPKFLLIGTHISTTETFKGISEFFNTDISENATQVSFFAGYYFLAAHNKIYNSENGYDWKFIHETEQNVALLILEEKQERIVGIIVRRLESMWRHQVVLRRHLGTCLPRQHFVQVREETQRHQEIMRMHLEMEQSRLRLEQDQGVLERKQASKQRMLVEYKQKQAGQGRAHADTIQKHAVFFRRQKDFAQRRQAHTSMCRADIM